MAPYIEVLLGFYSVMVTIWAICENSRTEHRLLLHDMAIGRVVFGPPVAIFCKRCCSDKCEHVVEATEKARAEDILTWKFGGTIAKEYSNHSDPRKIVSANKKGVYEETLNDHISVPRNLAIERLAKWLHDPPRTLRTDKWENMPNKPKGPDKWGIRRGDGKECWRENARNAINAMEGKA